MHILILGAAGMIGRKLTDRLVRDGGLNDRQIVKLTLVDIVTPEEPTGFTGASETLAVDFSAPGVAKALLRGRPDLIFHLAAIVSGEAERDFEKGYRINLDGTRQLFEAIRTLGEGYCPKVIYASSGAVFGGAIETTIRDDFHLTPHSSYGTQKAICELLLADYTRRGFLEGVGVRLPTICVRPGKPNAAVTGFFSGIIREPLVGQEAVLPVSDTITHTHASPRAAVNFLTHAGSLNRDQLGLQVNLTMPGFNCRVSDQIAALRRVAGQNVVDRVRVELDPQIARVVGVKPAVEATRALALGFTAERSFDEIILAHIEDELGGDFVR